MELARLLLLPLLGASICLFIKQDKIVRNTALVISLVSLAFTLDLITNFIPNASIQFLVDQVWISRFGIHFKLGIDGISMILVLLTNTLIPIIILANFKQQHKNAHVLHALILFMQTALLVVFTALDGFLFYVGWEAALIPIYFICAIWGGENRIQVNLKFFIYTIAGSLLMLLAIIYLHLQTPNSSYDIAEFYKLSLDKSTQSWLFWAFFIAFAIKMPVFPFHTWQPDTYTEAPTVGTMLLSGIMLKMGIYGVIRWLIPVVPMGFVPWGQVALTLSIIGVIYASIIAFTQKNVKRLIAYSSIAHVGLISAGIFAWNVQGVQGAIIQLFNHGINVVGLFFVLDIIMRRMSTYKLNELGGIATVAPKLAIAFLIILLGTVALPLTNGFIGEFLLLMGIYEWNIWYAAIAGLTIILGAVYMFRMYQQVMLGEVNTYTAAFTDIDVTEGLVLFILCALIIVMGVYPQPILHISEAAVDNLLDQVNQKILLSK